MIISGGLLLFQAFALFQHPMTDHERSILRKWQTGDNILYQHFVSKFKKQIEAFGLSRMEKDLARLKEIRKENLGINDFLTHFYSALRKSVTSSDKRHFALQSNWHFSDDVTVFLTAEIWDLWDQFASDLKNSCVNMSFLQSMSQIDKIITTWLTWVGD